MLSRQYFCVTCSSIRFTVVGKMPSMIACPGETACEAHKFLNMVELRSYWYTKAICERTARSIDAIILAAILGNPKMKVAHASERGMEPTETCGSILPLLCRHSCRHRTMPYAGMLYNFVDTISPFPKIQYRAYPSGMPPMRPAARATDPTSAPAAASPAPDSPHPGSPARRNPFPRLPHRSRPFPPRVRPYRQRES